MRPSVLTVIQYAVMSFVILIANIVTSQYTTLYMVHDAKMGQAEAGGGKFEGAVADLSRERFKAGHRTNYGPCYIFHDLDSRFSIFCILLHHCWTDKVSTCK